MARSFHTIALICGNEALAALLSGALAASPRLRIRRFETAIALAFYARIAKVDLIVADLDGAGFDAEVIEASDVGRGVPVVGLMRRAAPAEGVDEVIAKPMSPRYLLERVLARLDGGRPPALRASPGDNVVLLFGRELSPQP